LFQWVTEGRPLIGYAAAFAAQDHSTSLPLPMALLLEVVHTVHPYNDTFALLLPPHLRAKMTAS
jgi:hypothetical protein